MAFFVSVNEAETIFMCGSSILALKTPFYSFRIPIQCRYKHHKKVAIVFVLFNDSCAAMAAVDKLVTSLWRVYFFIFLGCRKCEKKQSTPSSFLVSMRPIKKALVFYRFSMI